MSESRRVLEFSKPPSPKPLVELINATLGYRYSSPKQPPPDGTNIPSIVVVEGVNLTAAPGSRIAVIGGNRSGKRTLLRTIAGHIEPLHGSVRVQAAASNAFDLGQEWRGTEDLHALRRRYFLASGFTAEEAELFDQKIAHIPEQIVGRGRPGQLPETEAARRHQYLWSVASSRPIVLCDTDCFRGDASWRDVACEFLAHNLRADTLLILSGHDHDIMGLFCKRAVWLGEKRMLADGPFAEVRHNYLRTSRPTS